MFKKPFEVKIDADSLETKHEIKVSRDTMYQIQDLVVEIEKTAIRTIVAGAAAVATSQILVHIAKTKIK